ncbi:unnamed protein product [Medioppia subpectinata]|uniref:Uncharacterized protein n=1 Tax=Medioppia subpectinata TaxID=1979941 RepID=A0A7R9KTI8_9ACAR|nr:unnamed protein product [Medioppia subpectinata]CAG2109594.1 unnamed protein product [Medioppia subpectinata]
MAITNKIINCKMASKYLLDSMDRFGDDLCEVLLSYLSFEDRFRKLQNVKRLEIGAEGWHWKLDMMIPIMIYTTINT